MRSKPRLKNPNFTLVLYRFLRRVIYKRRVASLYLFKVRFRFVRKLTHRISRTWKIFVQTRYRFARRLRFRYFRVMIFFIWRLWLKNIYGFDKIPQHESAIIVSNHLSFFDFWILSAILKKNTHFVAVKNLDKRSLVGWTMKLNPIIYVDREKPGAAFFKKSLKQLTEQNRLLVIYPEGTRSRTGKMLTPKPGFIKLAMKANVPIIPVAMRGTYDILPPHKKVPRLKRCDIHIGDKFYVSPNNPELYDVFYRKSGKDRQFKHLDDIEIAEIAFRVMDKVRVAANEEWDSSVSRPALQVPEEVMERQRQLLKQRA